MDFDGTLVPIQPRPEMVWLSASTRRLVRRLANHSGLTVAVISGRRLADVRRRARVPGVRYVGLHGWEWEGEALAAEAGGALAELKLELRKSLGPLPGIRLEDKVVSLAIHYRSAAPGVVRRAAALLRRGLRPYTTRLRVLRGKKIWEVLSPEVQGKGRAARLLLAEMPAGTLPIYVGDDTTDESAFAELRGGITVRVGRWRKTKARFQLRNPDDVICFLERMEAEIQ